MDQDDRDKKDDKAYYSSNRPEMAKYIPTGAKTILDVGCGAGNFGALLKSRMSVEVWGIEKLAEVGQIAETKLDKVIIGDVGAGDIQLPTNYFDCVVFNDVIEHLVNPWSVLKRMRMNIVNKGMIVASIPNVRYWDNIKRLLLFKEWDYEDAYILDRTHLRFFTIKSIEKLFQQCGYELISIEGINKSSFTWKFKLLNLALNRSLDDMQALQFACVARRI